MQAVVSNLFENEGFPKTSFAMAKFWKRIFNVCIKVALRLIQISYHGFSVVLFLGRKQVVPPIKDPILLKSAVNLAAEIREGKVKSEDVIMAYIERILIVNPFINAICDQCFNEALENARKVDKLISSHTKTLQQLEEETPLLGIPFTVKLLLGVKGMPCNGGSLLHKERKACEDAEVVDLMKKAGAICLAVTNSPEFGFSFETYNSIYGRTSNPYDTTRTSGGSSGGEGALLGSGGSLIGIGNDLCGSIRHPGNFNGVFGHKPTAGLISNEGTFPLPGPSTDKYLTSGPMCRYAADLALTTRILCGAKTTEINLSVPIDFSKVKFYYLLGIKDPFSIAVSSDVKNAILKVVDHLQSVRGVEAKEVNFKEMQQGFAIFIHMAMVSMDSELEDIFSGGELKISPTEELFKTMFFQSKMSIGAVSAMNLKKIPLICSEQKLPKITEQLQKFQEKLSNILDKDSLLIMPTFPIPAHYHYESIPLLVFHFIYMAIFNILGNPVTQCPVGLNGSKLPLGFQIVGAKGQDHLTIAFAKEMEKTFGGWVPPNSNE